MSDQEFKMIVCNVAVSNGTFPPGAKCFVLNVNPGDGGESSIEIMGRSRGGRWVSTWIRTRRLRNFRIKTIAVDDPLYERLSERSSPHYTTDAWANKLGALAHEQRERNGIATEERHHAQS